MRNLAGSLLQTLELPPCFHLKLWKWVLSAGFAPSYLVPKSQGDKVHLNPLWLKVNGIAKHRSVAQVGRAKDDGMLALVERVE